MAGGELLREFMITLGYKVDAGSQRNFENGVVAITAVVSRLAGAAAAAAEAVTVATTSIGRNLEDLYWASQRTGSSAREINAFSYAVEQMGGSAEGARGALDGLSRALRTNPGMQALVNLITGKQEAGRGAAEQLFDLARSFKALRDSGQYFVASQFAQQLGIDEDTLLAMTRGIDKFGDDYRAFAKAFGLDTKDATEAGVAFDRELRKLGAELGAFKRDVGGEFLPWLTESVGSFKAAAEILYAAAKTAAAAAHLLGGNTSAAQRDIGQAGTALSRGTMRTPTAAEIQAARDQALRENPTLYRFLDWVGGLLKPGAPGKAPRRAAAGSSPSFGGLNNPGNLRSWGDMPVVGGFAKFPTALAGISAMVGNLLAYKRHGWDSVQSIISHWAPPNENDTAAYIRDVARRLGVDPGAKLDLGNASTLQSLTDAIIRHEQGREPFSAGLIAQAVGARLGASGQGNAQVVTLNQKTDIRITGAADPDSTGRAVAGSQDRTNGDLVRNMAGAVR